MAICANRTVIITGAGGGLQASLRAIDQNVLKLVDAPAGPGGALALGGLAGHIGAHPVVEPHFAP